MNTQDFCFILKQNSHLLREGCFGLEKENVRVNQDGTLALTPHPAVFGDKGKHPYITTDFSESQVEMITPPLPSVGEALGFMETLHDVVTENIGDELLWPQSLPPVLKENQEIPIAHYSGEFKDKEYYRQKLAGTYGKERQLISGIHFNFSFSEKLMDILLKSGVCGNSMEEVRETVYFRVVRNFLKYRWLFIWLYGESPLAEETLNVISLKTGEKQPMKCGVSLSLRTSPLGYRNREEFFIDYSSLEAYNMSIDKLIRENRIDGPHELYLPVRIKFLEKDNGSPSYIEVRIVDLDPFTKSGVCASAIYFSHLLLVYSLLKEENGSLTEEELQRATRNQDMASCYGRDEKKELKCCSTTVQQKATSILEDMERILSEYGVLDNETYHQEMQHNLYLVQNPEKRIGMVLYENINRVGFVPFHLEKARQYREATISGGYRFHGLEDMEMSTQLLLKAAILKGVGFEILDRKENFIRLFDGKKEEYVMQATKTSLDSYVSVLMMENKVVTKKVLERAGISVPGGYEYTSPEAGMADYRMYAGKPVVIKPKSTNFGLGITILKHNYDETDFKAALQIAFEHDNTVLIEKFIPGREFRIFIINDEVVGILHRVPANVTGDGVLNIGQLIDRKNEDPLRGKGYRTPLEKIRKGREEEMFLKQQGMDFNTVPKEREVVYLRENSNISTGGDSIDFTDDIDDSYKAIAVEAAKALNVKITGLDMMIQDIHAPATPDNYAIIEMNFNPAIHIHCYPFKGKNRHLNHKMIRALGF